MKYILLLRPKKEVVGYAREAAAKFKAISNVELHVHASKNLNEFAAKIETGYAPIIFCESMMENNEINTLMGTFGRAKPKPYFITNADNFERVVKATHRNYVCRAMFDFTKDFIFNCIRNLLTPENQKMDIRYIKSIVTNVADVVLENTQHKLTPQKISEVRVKEISEEIAVVSTFLGDGFLGSLTLGTTKSLVKSFAIKMLFCEESDVNDEMLTDLIAELSNQILGAIRNTLSEFGYQLTASMHLVVSGEEFKHASSTSGHYYGLPFHFEDEKFDVTFCYNSYRTSIREIEETTAGNKGKVLDVRLVDATVEAFKEVIQSNIQVEVEINQLSSHPAEGIKTISTHIFHCANWQGSYTILLEAPKPAIQVFKRLMFGMEDEEIDYTMVNDIFGEIINQIGGIFLKSAAQAGYRYNRIFHGEFAGPDIEYLYKNPGQYCRYLVKFEGAEMILMFGMNSEFAPQYFNIWPYFMRQNHFKDSLFADPGALPEGSSTSDTEPDHSSDAPASEPNVSNESDEPASDEPASDDFEESNEDASQGTEAPPEEDDGLF